MLHALLMIVHFFCAAGIVALVLLQRGKGADAGAGFGSGASGTVFGARGATTALSRATAVLAGVFMLTSLALAYVGSKATPASNSILERLSHQTGPSAPIRVPGSTSFGVPAGAGQAPASTGQPPAAGGGTGTNGSGTPGIPGNAPTGGAAAPAPSTTPQGAPPR